MSSKDDILKSVRNKLVPAADLPSLDQDWIQYGDAVAHFASYVFCLQAGPGLPIPHSSEKISEFRAVLPGQLGQVAADLRNLYGDRRGWGQWRALAHDLVSELLTG